MQFGVPSEMPRIMGMLEKLNMDEYERYLGFDSFVGLPQESADALRTNPHAWGVGQFSAVHELSDSFRKLKNPRTQVGSYVPRLGNRTRALRLEEVAKVYDALVNHSAPRSAHRRQWVVGYYNQSLTAELGASVNPAAYVDINCDLYVSTSNVFNWLAKHRLLRRGSVIGYDDWFDTPFLLGGESMAHADAAVAHGIEFELLPWDRWSQTSDTTTGPLTGCRSVMFRVRSIGRRADPGLTPQLNNFSCTNAANYAHTRSGQAAGMGTGEYAAATDVDACFARASDRAQVRAVSVR